MYYTTLSIVKSQLKLGAADVSDDALLLRWIRYSSKFIELYKESRYDIYRETKLFDTPLLDAVTNPFAGNLIIGVGNTSPNKLRLNDDLIEVVTITNGDAEVVSSDDYVLEHARLYPKSRVVLLDNANVVWETDDNGNYRQAISIDGYWGYATDPINQWVNTNDAVVDAPLTINATVLNVTDADGTASDLLSPRFEVGQMIRIGTEFLFVTSITDNALTVVRGYNGTDPAEHVATTQIDVFRPDDRIAQMCLRLVTWRYRQKDTDQYDKVFDGGSNTVVIPSALPVDVAEILGGKRVRMY